jgi:hypothetical protein
MNHLGDALESKNREAANDFSYSKLYFGLMNEFELSREKEIFTNYLFIM